MRALRRRKSQPSASVSASQTSSYAVGYATLAAACTSAATGLELLVRRTREPSIAAAAKGAADNLRSVAGLAVSEAASRGLDALPRARTGDRLRWEWLASTASVLDGAADERVLEECARVLGEAIPTVTRALAPRGKDKSADHLCDRLRLASAEAYSLAHTAAFDRRTAGEELPGSLALALA
jgi:hypothetical protein